MNTQGFANKKARGSRHVCVLIASLLWFQLLAPAKASGEQHLAILYPEIREPYRQIFLNIIDGIKSSYDGKIYVYALKKESNPAALSAWLTAKHADAVIGLGKRGFRTLLDLKPDMPIFVGATVIPPDNNTFSGISQSPAPSKLFKQLHKLQPSIKRIHLPYQKDNKNGSLIDSALIAANTQKLELVLTEVNDIRELASHYRQLLENINPQEDALWISYNGVGLDKSLVHQILETAWQRNMVVFSSNVADVKRGALYSLYPDNYAMGQRLAELVLAQEKTMDASAVVQLVDDLLLAINLRTADHLGLLFDENEKRDFGLVFPPYSHQLR